MKALAPQPALEARTMIPVFGHAPRPTRRRGGLRRVLTAWLALLGLFVQLTRPPAPAPMGGAPADARIGRGPFPICHAYRPADDDATRGHDPAPSHHDACPFCSTCCHAAIALPQGFAVPTRVAVVATEPGRPAVLPSLAPRCHGGASLSWATASRLTPCDPAASWITPRVRPAGRHLARLRGQSHTPFFGRRGLEAARRARAIQGSQMLRTPTKRRLGALAAVCLVSGASPTLAHTIVGNRVFPATLAIDDPGVNDELTLPVFSQITAENFDGTTGPKDVRARRRIFEDDHRRLAGVDRLRRRDLPTQSARDRLRQHRARHEIRVLSEPRTRVHLRRRHGRRTRRHWQLGLLEPAPPTSSRP